MSLNATVSAERPHIAFFGMRNAGKSSLVNAVTGQQLAVVSDVKGTTTDPVKKAMELLPWARLSSSTPPVWTTRESWVSCGCKRPGRFWRKPILRFWW